MEPLISVIMPVFNSENVVERAIRSVLKQTYQSWELLIVDDCSTDHTVEVIKRWIDKDSRIRLFCQEKNYGPGAAKNRGLLCAKGDYITFCDADDWIDREAFQILVDNTEGKYDTVISGFYRDIKDQDGKLLERTIVKMDAFTCANKIDVLKSIIELDQNRLFSYAVNKLFKRKIIEKNKVFFSNKKFGEDFDFNIDFFCHVDNMKVIDQGFYHYVKQNRESLTERYIPDFYEINKERFEKISDLMIDNGCYTKTVRQKIMSLYVKHVSAAIARLYDPRGGLLWKERRRKAKEILKDDFSRKAALEAFSKKRSEMICNMVFKTRNVTINLIYGYLLWFMQTKGKKLYEKIK